MKAENEKLKRKNEDLEERLAIVSPDVVYCKDCKKRYDSMNCPIALIADLLKNTRVFEYKVSDNWFCADGEQKEGE